MLIASALCFTVALGAKTFYETGVEPWGIDADLLQKKEVVKTAPQPLLSRLCMASIRFFQKEISPIDGPRSSFIPTSSMYALLAIKKYGPLKGIALGCDRLLRENGDPWVYKTTDKYARIMKLDPVR